MKNISELSAQLNQTFDQGKPSLWSGYSVRC